MRIGKRAGHLKGYSCQRVVDESISWLDGLKETSPKQPFFLFCALHEPHEPVASPPELVAKYKSVARNEDEAQYFANVENVDRATGRLLKALNRLGKSENTMVIFTSDNGSETLRRYCGAGRSYGTPAPLRGMKLWTTEAGFRVAGIISWPARIKSPAVSHEAVSSLDFLPTFCKLAGTKPPKNLKLDGTSFLPVLEGEQIRRSTPLFWCYFNALNEHRVAMRDGPWKLLARLDEGRFPKLQNVNDRNIKSVRSATLTDFELYLLTGNSGESTNIIEKHREQAAMLKKKLDTIYRDLADTSHHWTTPNTNPKR